MSSTPPPDRDTPQHHQNIHVNKRPLKLVLVSPRGFCAGVQRAIDIVERALDIYGAPVYVKHEIVHNARVINILTQKGVVFVDDIDDIPDTRQPVIFSAHGVSRMVVEQAKARGFNTIDATCPLVTKVHVEVRRAVEHKKHVVFIGHHDHPEAEGTVGQVSDGNVTVVETAADARNVDLPTECSLTYVTQTTLSVRDTQDIVAILLKRYPHLKGPRRQDICFATENRQRALSHVAPTVDAFLVIGSANSSNTMRLVELAQRETKTQQAWRIDAPSELPIALLHKIESVGLTAGASAPSELLDMTIRQLEDYFILDVSTHVHIKEDVTFALPSALTRAASGDKQRDPTSACIAEPNLSLS